MNAKIPNETKNQTLKALILEIVKTSYEAGEPPIQAKIVDKILDYRNKNIFDLYYETDSIQPSVSRTLKRMVQDKQLIKLPDKTYTPFDITVARKQIAVQIMKEIEFNREEIFCMSESVILLDIHPKSVSRAKDLFAQYLGQRNCYDIVDFQGYVMLMLLSDTTDKKDLEKLTEDIRKIAKKEYTGE